MKASSRQGMVRPPIGCSNPNSSSAWLSNSWNEGCVEILNHHVSTNITQTRGTKLVYCNKDNRNIKAIDPLFFLVCVCNCTKNQEREVRRENRESSVCEKRTELVISCISSSSCCSMVLW